MMPARTKLRRVWRKGARTASPSSASVLSGEERPKSGLAMGVFSTEFTGNRKGSRHLPHRRALGKGNSGPEDCAWRRHCSAVGHKRVLFRAVEPPRAAEASAGVPGVTLRPRATDRDRSSPRRCRPLPRRRRSSRSVRRSRRPGRPLACRFRGARCSGRAHRRDRNRRSLASYSTGPPRTVANHGCHTQRPCRRLRHTRPATRPTHRQRWRGRHWHRFVRHSRILVGTPWCTPVESPRRRPSRRRSRSARSPGSRRTDRRRTAVPEGRRIPHPLAAGIRPSRPRRRPFAPRSTHCCASVRRTRKRDHRRPGKRPASLRTRPFGPRCRTPLPARIYSTALRRRGRPRCLHTGCPRRRSLWRQRPAARAPLPARRE